MIRLRSIQLADHTVCILYRWIAWSVTALWLLWSWPIDTASVVVLLVTALVNIPATIFARQYTQLARVSPSIMSLDIFYTVVVLVASGGWQSNFLLYSYSSLVLPALLFGWRGGLMAGLSYVTMSLAGLWAAGAPPSEFVLDGPWSGAQLAAMMIVPPAFGCLVALVIENVHRSLAQRRPSHRTETDGDRGGQRTRAASGGFASLGRSGAADNRSPEMALTTQIVRIRTAEQGVEELRRELFAPFPATALDLAASLDLLAVRFEKLTGAPARVSLLGRTRALHHVHRELLVRLTQEALINIRQHANASTAMLTLRFDSTSVALLIQDDGVGLIDGTYERPGLHALRAMHYRLAEFGGRLDVFETEGGGVTVRATMPLE